MTFLPFSAAPAALTVLFAAGNAYAQSELDIGIGLRGGRTHPGPCIVCESTQDAPFAGIGEAFVEFRFHGRTHPPTTYYAGYSRFSVNPRGREDATTGSGFVAGVRVAWPASDLVAFWVGAGAVLQRHTSTVRGTRIGTDHGWGGELGVGLAFVPAPWIEIAPGVRYRGHAAQRDRAEAERLGVFRRTELGFFILDIGLSVIP